MKSSEMSFARPSRPRSSGLSLLCLGLLAASAHAASIEFAGIESGKTVENWSNPNPVIDETMVDLNDKTLDLNGDNRFGGAGYYQITPAGIGIFYSQDTNSGNDLGITLDTEGLPTGQYTTSYSPPDFLIGNPQGAACTFINLDGFPLFRNPQGDAFIQQGSAWIFIDVENTEFGEINGSQRIRNNAFGFKLNQVVGFRLGVAVDSMADRDYAVDYVSVTHTVSGEVFSLPLHRDGAPDMVFFDISGEADDEFIVSLWQANEELPNENRVGFSLITFDQEPVPNLSHVLDGSSLMLSWEPEIPGWTLESSTNLGISDWTAVTEPAVVDNSVTLDITGVPQKFFRLRKDP